MFCVSQWMVWCIEAQLDLSTVRFPGMLLEIDNSELLYMLEHNDSLKSKVEEAVAVLQAHQAKQAAVKKD